MATPYRHGNKEAADAFFLDGMAKAFSRLAEQAHPGFPSHHLLRVQAVRAYGRSDTETASTGWETFLDAVIRSGFGI